MQDRTCWVVITIVLSLIVLSTIQRKYQEQEAPRLVLRDTHGDIVLNRSLWRLWQEPLRIWNCSEELLAVVHISKSAGTSFNKALTESLARHNNKLVCSDDVITSYRNRNCSDHVTAYCDRHFDWTLLWETGLHGVKMAPLVVLRDPVARFISNFHYAKTRPIWRGTRMINQSLSEYLNDAESMMETRYLWHDGQAAVSWLAGTHMYNVVLPRTTYAQLKAKERHATDWSYTLNTALHNLHACLWVGLFEDTSRGRHMLRYQTGIDIRLKKLNVNKVKHPELTPEVIQKIRFLMPMDLYLYEYAKRLHNHRWRQYLKETNQHEKERPLVEESDHSVNETRQKRPLVENTGTRAREEISSKDLYLGMPGVIKGCKSTRYWLGCPRSTYLYPGVAENVAEITDFTRT